jgi:type VI secretion system protein ImpL
VELVGSGTSAASGDGAAARLRALAATQPEPLRGWLAQVGGSGQSLSMAAERRRIGQAWQADVLPLCQRAIAGRYPLANGEAEIPMGDFARFFGPGGVLERFFEQHLAPYVDRRGSYRWNARGAELGIPGSFLALFERGGQVRDAYFGGGGEPRIRFSLTPQYLDASVDQVVLSYDGRPLSYSHGPQIPWELTWPPTDSRRIDVVFHLPQGEQPALSATGVWGLFRLLESADVRPEFEAGAFVSFSQGDRSVTFRLQANSIENPFVSSELRGFRCPAGV